jgi:hypothetical protein
MPQAIRADAGARTFRLLIYGLIPVSSATQFALVPVMPVDAHRSGRSGLQQGMAPGMTGLVTLAGSVPAGPAASRVLTEHLPLAVPRRSVHM